MKFNILTALIIGFFLISCSSSNNSDEFIAKYEGRYLYNSDEVLEVYFENNDLFIKWRGANSIKPLRVTDNTFYVKEMNEKIQFLTKPESNKEYIGLVPKVDTVALIYNYKKLGENENIPSEYLRENESVRRTALLSKTSEGTVKKVKKMLSDGVITL